MSMTSSARVLWRLRQSTGGGTGHGRRERRLVTTPRRFTVAWALRSRLRSRATISRIPLIGVPLATLRDRAGMRRVAVGGVHDGAVDPQDFYAYQVRMRDALRDRH